MTEYSQEYWKAINARLAQAHYKVEAAKQSLNLTFKPSDFHNLPCKPMKVTK